MSTVYEEVAGWLEHQQRKHDLGPTYVKDYLERLSAVEMLQLVSDAVEKRVADLEAELSNCRAQGLENENELVTLRLELQALTKTFEKHFHLTPSGMSLRPQGL